MDSMTKDDCSIKTEIYTDGGTRTPFTNFEAGHSV